MLVLIIACVVLLAYANGANDNFKGVATLAGSGTTDYRRALLWATSTTLLGSSAAVFLAGALLRTFSGQGLVDQTLTAEPLYATAVALATALTVLLATRLGMPISTTHALVGSLVGAGIAAGSSINLHQLGTSFFLPLLVSPMLALAITGLIYPLLSETRRRLGITTEACICIGREVVEVLPAPSQVVTLERIEDWTVRVDDPVTCQNHYQGSVLGIEADAALDRLHYLSAGVVSFSRGLNDTPKIAALLLLAPQISGSAGTALVGVAIAVGGLLSARQVAETMSTKITTMNHGQGLTANLITGLITIGASRYGLPVSTTHVSCGALFGIGAVTRQAQWSTIRQILTAWITTLPLGIALGAAAYCLLRA